MTLADRKLRVLTVRDRYPALFNTPRTSRHEIERRRFVPFNLFFRPLEGATFVNPLPLHGFDLLHAFNRIPFGPTPFIMSFESHLPRVFGREGGAVAKLLRQQLLSRRCLRILPMSQFARRIFLSQHADSPRLPELEAKLMVRLPNFVIPEMTEWFDGSQPIEELRVLFVGAHFARKGGLAAVKLAEKARAAGVPIHVTIVSTLQHGAGIWTDPTNAAFYEPYLKLLEAPNVTLIRGAPNSDVLKLMKQSHLSFLPTFGDTFGYSAVEGMIHFTPVIATSQGALPEFIDDSNGVMLNLPTSAVGEWVHMARPDRDSPAFEKVFADETERLAEESLAACRKLIDDPQRLAAMRLNARKTVEQKFDAVDAAKFWDDLYIDLVAARG